MGDEGIFGGGNGFAVCLPAVFQHCLSRGTGGRAGMGIWRPFPADVYNDKNRLKNFNLFFYNASGCAQIMLLDKNYLFGYNIFIP